MMDDFFERMNYFSDQLMTESDFRAEQEYFNNKRWLINRLIVDCGTVCGLEVVAGSGETVEVKKGFAIDCYGREIKVPADVSVDIGEDGLQQKYFICIRYCEEPDKPVRVSQSECRRREFQFSRIREKYEIKAFPDDNIHISEEQTDGGQCCTERCEEIIQTCPECCEPSDAGWLVLASLNFNPNADNGQKITDIDNCAHRKLIYSNFMLYDIIRCIERQAVSAKVSADAKTLTACGTDTSTITAVVTDVYGRPVRSETVTMEITEGTGSMQAVDDAVEAITDENGACEAVYKAGTEAGPVTITAITSKKIHDSITITLSPGPASSVEIAACPNSLPACGTRPSKIIVTVKDEHKNPVTDEEVTMAIATEREGVGSVTTPAAHMSEGRYEAIYTAGTVPGTDTISATTSNGVPGSVEIILEEIPAFCVKVEATPDILPALGRDTDTSAITVTVTDIHGNPIRYEELEIAVSPDLGDHGSVDPVTVVTDEYGRCNATYTAGTEAGIVTIKATTSNDVSGVAKIELKPYADLEVKKRVVEKTEAAPSIGDHITHKVVAGNRESLSDSEFNLVESKPGHGDFVEEHVKVISLKFSEEMDPDRCMVDIYYKGSNITFTSDVIGSILNVIPDVALQMPGSYYLRVTVYDKAGSMAEAEVQFEIGGTELAYTVTVSNNGPADATGVEVTDELPGEVVYLSHDPPEARYVPETGVWTVGNLAVDDSAVLTIEALVNAGTTGTIINEASVTADQPDHDPANNSSAAFVNVGTDKASSEDVTDVRGVGQSTKKALESIQMRTVAELADSTVEVLKSAGINEERARNIIAEANRMLGGEDV